ncbi:MAG: glycosyltransferase family 4 protein [Anaerolineae bacterium]|nr:glycosyltransferase family 4 protein [Anaerolineae bacterium]
MRKPSTTILHYTAPPVVGGVEAVIWAHTRIFAEHGYPVTVMAGRGDASALPSNTAFMTIPEIDSQHPQIMQLSALLEQGQVGDDFGRLTEYLTNTLAAKLEGCENLIVHNILTKHFNLPLTVAIHNLIDSRVIRHCIAWCHDFTWTSPNSRSKVHPGYPWDLLRTYRRDVTYVVVSKRRQTTLATLLGCQDQSIQVIYNGVEPKTLLGLSDEGCSLIDRLDLIESDLVLVMPVRVTQAKNIEFALGVVAELKAQGCLPKLIVTGPPDPHDSQSMEYFRELQALRKKLKIEKEARFVFESGHDPEVPYTVELNVVGDLLRICDAMFMPSHREGFGMPVLEAGLIGVPVICTKIPAAEEIGGDDVLQFESDEEPAKVAATILTHLGHSSEYRLRRRVRQHYTWRALFRRQIEPLLNTRSGREESGV